jgi:HAD superfamily hydrolase (TIGR01509 family)
MQGKLALICDCDGVLINSEAIAGAVLIRELGNRWPGIDLEELVMPLLGVQTERLLFNVAGLVGKRLSMIEIDEIYRAVQKEAIEAPVVDGIVNALAQIPLIKACASNSTFNYVRTAMQRTGLNAFFAERLFTADMVSNPKPAPDVYLLAASRIGVLPEHCVVIEDSVAGATAAVAAGMMVIGFTGTSHRPEEQKSKLLASAASVTFANMEELPALVEKWRS